MKLGPWYQDLMPLSFDIQPFFAPSPTCFCRDLVKYWWQPWISEVMRRLKGLSVKDDEAREAIQSMVRSLEDAACTQKTWNKTEETTAYNLYKLSHKVSKFAKLTVLACISNKYRISRIQRINSWIYSSAFANMLRRLQKHFVWATWSLSH